MTTNGRLLAQRIRRATARMAPHRLHSVHQNPNQVVMAKREIRRRTPVAAQSFYDQARDELFQHIMQCGVIGCAPEDQKEWFDTTIQYLKDRWHELTPEQLTELRTLGERFAAPAKSASNSSQSAA
jgi:hypothetical protein